MKDMVVAGSLGACDFSWSGLWGAVVRGFSVLGPCSRVSGSCLAVFAVVCPCGWGVTLHR